MNLFFYYSGTDRTVNGPEIRKLMKNLLFARTLSANELQAWNVIKEAIYNVLGGKRVPPEQMKHYVKNVMDAMKELKSSVTPKMHLLNNHLDDFINQSPKESDEHREHEHQIIVPIEKRFKGKNLDAALAEVIWWSQKMKHAVKEDEESEEDEITEASELDESIESDEEDEADGSDQSDDEKKAKAGRSTSEQRMEID